ncbi:branched-chain amino acid ABC transporter permease [Ferrovibrio sp.]|uniref:branched-chain amino acid ABC transporter permease n=1 Tax=Ferrovibrio sp. TaxID=1917215 RepID=UPI0026322C5B|nr:branched-chain amino acid ABC transporter permease [Ferrovibrio sp.]
MDLAFVTLLNALSYGLLLFMLAAGLTLVFSLMGIMNFAHASLYMLGAYMAYSVSSQVGFWGGLVVAPVIVAGIGMVIERYILRHLHARGHIPELLFTFGLVLLIEESVKLVWGLGAVDYRVPVELRGTLFELFGARFPMHKGFVIVVALLSLSAIWWLVVRTRTGLVVRAALANPGMVESLGHDVGRVFTLVFGLGVGLAGLAGAVGGAVLVTEPAMAAHLGTIIFVVVVVGGLGSIKGALIASVLIGTLETFLIALDVRLSDVLAPLTGLASGLDAVLALKASQVAPIMPYLLMVAMLIFRPRGLFGEREI